MYTKMIYHLSSIRITTIIEKRKITSIVKEVAKLQHLHIVSRIVKWNDTMENSMKNLHKMKSRFTI